MNVSREIDMMQFHLVNPLFIDGFIIKSGMNIIKRVEKGGKDYVIYHSDDFSTPYTDYPLDHVVSLMTFVCKKLIDGGMVVVDENKFEAVEIKPGTMRLVEKLLPKLQQQEIVEIKPRFKIA